MTEAVEATSRADRRRRRGEPDFVEGVSRALTDPVRWSADLDEHLSMIWQVTVQPSPGGTLPPILRRTLDNHRNGAVERTQTCRDRLAVSVRDAVRRPGRTDFGFPASRLTATFARGEIPDPRDGGDRLVEFPREADGARRAALVGLRKDRVEVLPMALDAQGRLHVSGATWSYRQGSPATFTATPLRVAMTGSVAAALFGPQDGQARLERDATASLPIAAAALASCVDDEGWIPPDASERAGMNGPEAGAIQKSMLIGNLVAFLARLRRIVFPRR